MGKILVLDASVIYKWLVDEPGEDTRKARILRDEYVAGKREVLAPTLLFVELGNIFTWKSSLTISDLRIAWSLLLRYKLPISPFDASFIEEVMVVARTYTISLYDAVYVALAQSKQGEMITADKKLVRSVGKPFVRLL